MITHKSELLMELSNKKIIKGRKTNLYNKIDAHTLNFKCKRIMNNYYSEHY